MSAVTGPVTIFEWPGSRFLRFLSDESLMEHVGRKVYYDAKFDFIRVARKQTLTRGGSIVRTIEPAVFLYERTNGASEPIFVLTVAWREDHWGLSYRGDTGTTLRKLDFARFLWLLLSPLNLDYLDLKTNWFLLFLDRLVYPIEQKLIDKLGSNDHYNHVLYWVHNWKRTGSHHHSLNLALHNWWASVAEAIGAPSTAVHLETWHKVRFPWVPAGPRALKGGVLEMGLPGGRKGFVDLGAGEHPLDFLIKEGIWIPAHKLDDWIEANIQPPTFDPFASLDELSELLNEQPVWLEPLGEFIETVKALQ